MNAAGYKPQVASKKEKRKIEVAVYRKPSTDRILASNNVKK